MLGEPRGRELELAKAGSEVSCNSHVDDVLDIEVFQWGQVRIHAPLILEDNLLKDAVQELPLLEASTVPLVWGGRGHRICWEPWSPCSFVTAQAQASKASLPLSGSSGLMEEAALLPATETLNPVGSSLSAEAFMTWLALPTFSYSAKYFFFPMRPWAYWALGMRMIFPTVYKKHLFENITCSIMKSHGKTSYKIS